MEDTSTARFDGVEATVTAERAFSGLDGRYEQVSALVELGETGRDSVGVVVGSHVDGVLVAPAYRDVAAGEVDVRAA